MLVSIAIPTYQRLHYLKEAVQSALNQTYPTIEVIIGQDPAPAGQFNSEIKEWAEALATNNTKVKYFLNSTNLGLAGNWNSLAEKASGEYAIIIGDDDRIKPNSIATMAESFSLKPDVIFSNQDIINENGEKLDADLNALYHRNILLPGILSDAEATIWRNSVPMSSSLIKTEWLRKLKFKNDLNTPEIEFFLRLADQKGTFYYTPAILTEYRVHQNSATSQGLRVHNLLKYLIALPVSEGNRPLKYQFISSSIIPATNLCLKEGNKKQAKLFLDSTFYPHSFKASLKKIVQRLFYYLPTNLVIKIYKFL